MRLPVRTTVGALALAASMLISSVAHADATPVQLILTYMPNVSNTGSSAASGIAELVLLEGEVRVSAAGLPRLEAPERYVAWLVNTQSNSTYRLGEFNSSADSEQVRFEDVLPDAIPNRQWNLLLVTIEKDQEPIRPSAQHSIAGTFPRAQSDPPPALLPNTGGLSDEDLPLPPGHLADAGRSAWLPALGLAALSALVAGGAGYAVGKRTRD